VLGPRLISIIASGSTRSQRRGRGGGKKKKKERGKREEKKGDRTTANPFPFEIPTHGIPNTPFTNCGVEDLFTSPALSDPARGGRRTEKRKRREKKKGRRRRGTGLRLRIGCIGSMLGVEENWKTGFACIPFGEEERGMELGKRKKKREKKKRKKTGSSGTPSTYEIKPRSQPCCRVAMQRKTSKKGKRGRKKNASDPPDCEAIPTEWGGDWLPLAPDGPLIAPGRTPGARGRKEKKGEGGKAQVFSNCLSPSTGRLCAIVSLPILISAASPKKGKELEKRGGKGGKSKRGRRRIVCIALLAGAIEVSISSAQMLE